MKTFNNTKQIPAKLLYDMFMKSFNEFYKEETKVDEALRFGIAAEKISIQSADGKEIYIVIVNDVVITIHAVSEDNELIGEKLDKFIQACLL